MVNMMPKELEAFIIILKSDEAATPDLEIKIRAADPVDCVVLAARILDLYRQRFKVDPIVEILP